MLNGLLIANEVVKEVKRGRKDSIVFKVDFKKAYNSESWNFLYNM